MRRLLWLGFVLLLGASWAVAQDSATPGSTPTQSDSSQASSAQTVEGCLSGSNGKYTLTDQQGKSYDLTGDTSKLADHVGHEVKITGSASSGSSSSTGSQAGSGSGQTLEVSSFKHVSKTCKNAGGGMSH
jgi:hypothetical protein